MLDLSYLYHMLAPFRPPFWRPAPGVFFFQAEDGIRDIGVTGVQTCALPILEPKESEISGKSRGIRFDGRVDGDSLAVLTQVSVSRHVRQHPQHRRRELERLARQADEWRAEQRIVQL